MRKGIVASLASLVAGAGLAFGQAPQTPAGNNPTPAPAVLPDNAAAPAPEQAPPTTDETSAPMSPLGLGIPPGANAFSPDQQPEHHIFPLICGPERFWVSGEYLLWTVKNESIAAPLVTTGTASSSAILGAPGTSVAIGGSDVSFGELSGARVGIGFCNEDHDWGVELTGFLIERAGNNAALGSDASGSPAIGRPFINSATGAESVSLVSFPGAFSGSVVVSNTSEFGGAEVNLVHNMTSTLGATFDFLIGFRYLALDEELGITQSSVLLPGGVLGFNGSTVLAPANVSVGDTFRTHNDFYGGQIGAQVEFHPYQRIFAMLGGKIGFGDSHENVNASGYTSLSGTGAPASTVPGGLLAVAGNSGSSTRDAFSVVPEASVNVGVEITKNLRLFVGYSFIYWDNVARPGDQFSRTINPSTVPSSLSFGTGIGAANPANPIVKTDFWAQGLNVGFAFRY
jgi:hypothetical protein